MAMVNKTSGSHLKVKNTPLKHTDGKGSFKRMLSFLQVDKGRLFFLKIVLRGNQSTRNFHLGRSERLACFETPSSSEVFFKNYQVHFVLYSQENYVFGNILS